jgi:hypothetical protein
MVSATGTAEADEAARFLAATQADDGGWYWGWDAAKNAPIDGNQSTLTGAWILADLFPA